MRLRPRVGIALLRLLPIIGAAILSPHCALAKEKGFQSLFDGKTLDGWKAADMSYWSIEDGTITGKITPEH